MAEVAAPWLCCAGGSGETPRGAPPARGQRLLPGTEAPLGAPRVGAGSANPSHSARGQEPAQFFLWPLLFLWLPGSTRGPWLSPPAPSLYNQRGRDATGAAPLCPAPCPPAELWGLSPCSPGGAAGKARLSQQGLQSWQGWRGSGPLAVLGVVAGCHQGCPAAVLGRAAIPGQDRLPSCGAVTPLSPLSLCGAWLWMGMVWGVQPFSLQPQELLYCWGEAGPAAPPCPACHSLRSLDSMIVRLCAPSLLEPPWFLSFVERASWESPQSITPTPLGCRTGS